MMKILPLKYTLSILILLVFCLFEIQAQNVGIGVAAPNKKLQILDNGDDGSFTPTSWQIGSGKNGAGEVLIGTYENQPAIQGHGTGTSYRLLLNPTNGNVGVGTVDPTSKFEVDGSFYVDVGNAGNMTLFEHTGTGTPVPFNIRKTGYSGSSQQYGILQLDMNHNVVGGGSNLYFRLKNDVGSWIEYGGIGASIESNSGSGQGKLHFYTAGRTERMTILHNGNTGIGINNPNARLEVNGDIATARTNKIKFLENPGGGDRAFIRSTQNEFGGDYNGLMFAVGSGDEEMYLKSNGNLGLGTTNPTYKLHVNGSARVNSLNVNGAYNLPTSDGTSNYVLRTNGSGGVSWSDPNSLVSGDNLGNHTATQSLNLDWLWSSSDITNNSLYVQDGNRGFAFGVGTTVSTWFSYNGTVRRAIDVYNDGSRILMGNSGADVGIGAVTNPTQKLQVVGAAQFGESTGHGGIGGTDGARIGVRHTVSNGFAPMMLMVHSGRRTWDFGVHHDQSFRIRDVDAGSADRLTIANNGNVGIGTTSPDKTLHIAGGSTSGDMRFEHTHSRDAGGVTDGLASVGTEIKSIDFHYTGSSPNAVFAKIATKNYNGGGTGWYSIEERYRAGLSFYTTYQNNLQERMTINDHGNVSIGGNVDNNYKLRVYGKLRTDGINETSDKRFKKDIQSLDNSLDKVMQVQGVSYYWKVDEFPDRNFNTKKDIGVIAQEVEKIFPEVVDTDAEGYKSVQYSHLVPVLIEAMKELRAEKNREIQDLKSELHQYKALLDDIDLEKFKKDYAAENLSVDTKK